MLHGRVVDWHDFALVAAHAAFDAGNHFVFDADIGKGAAHHDFMVAATCAIAVKICLAHLML